MATRLPDPPQAADHPYWSQDASTLLESLGSAPGGLSAREAAERLAAGASRPIHEAAEVSAAALLLRQFQSPLVLILVFAAAVSLLLREWVDASIILAIVLGSALLSFSQEFRASSAVAELRRRLALTAKVRRDGEVRAVPFAELVPGDVVLLAAGDLVPADARVLQCKDLLVSEAPLTGESFPVEKRSGSIAPATPLAGRVNIVFLGASVRSGQGEALVVRTGRDTEFGAVAARLRKPAPPSDFARGLQQFGTMLLRVMLLIVVFVLMVNQLLGRPFIDSLLFAVALAVGLSPELLPAIVSVTLSAGARALARRGVIVRRLEAIENLGSMTVLCTDKTGTLTEGTIELQGWVDVLGGPSDRVAELAFVNARLETGIENPLDQAVVRAGQARGLTAGGWRKLGEIPYDFTRKRLTVAAAPEGAGPLLVTKGAFDQVLAVCASVRTPEGERPLDGPWRERLGDWFRARGEEGLRVLALATREAPVKDGYGVADEAGMRLEGFLLFMDPPKPEAAATVRQLAGLGVTVKVISGDNRHVAAHVARALDIPVTGVLTGAQIARMKPEALWARAERTTLFVEVDPEQKERIVRALQRRGHAVGYLGDGINDAPALHAADVGVSVDTAVDVARESADVVLLRRDLEVLRQGIEGGRRTFANTVKYICITTSANFGNMVSMALATPLLPFLPLLPKQILLNNFLSDFPSLAISSDRVDADQIARPQRWGIRQIQRFMVTFGLISSVFDLASFALLVWVFRAGPAGFRTAWFTLSVLTELAVVMVLRTHGPAWRSRPSGLLLWTTVAVGALALALPYLDGLAKVFGFVALGPGLIAAVLAIVAAYVAATEAAKLWLLPGRR
jgi:Mg2+-importing ATPase